MILSRLILIFGVIFCFYAAFSEGSPQLCGETTITFNSIYGNVSVSISADLKISSPNTTITVTNITANAATSDGTTVTLYNICAWERAGSVTFCNKNIMDSFSFSVGESNVVELQYTMSWTDSGFLYNQSQPFYSSVVDGNSFSFYDGRIYNEMNKCYYYDYSGDGVNQNVSECCTSMTPINITNTNQMCTHFTSASNITNISDNSIYASMMIDYELTNSNVTMVGKFSGSSGYEPYLIVDDAEGCVNILNNTIYCGYPLYPSGNKLLIFLAESFNNTQIFGFANRFIINGNLTLKSEDTAFTPSDNCTTFNNYPYDSTRMISTKACCTNFQDLVPTTTSQTSPASPVSSSSSQSVSVSATPSQASTFISDTNSSSSPTSPSSQSVSVSVPTTTTSGTKSFSDFNFVSLLLALIVSFGIVKA
jgi:hypothetical protein